MDVKCLPQLLPVLFFEAGFSLNLELNDLAGLTGQWALWLSIYVSSAEVTNTYFQAQLLCRFCRPKIVSHACNVGSLLTEPSPGDHGYLVSK